MDDDARVATGVLQPHVADDEVEVAAAVGAQPMLDLEFTARRREDFAADGNGFGGRVVEIARPNGVVGLILFFKGEGGSLVSEIGLTPRAKLSALIQL